MLRWEISPDFKAHRAGDIRRTVRRAPICANAPADRVHRAAAMLSLPLAVGAILLFSVGASGPQVVASVKHHAYQTAARLRAPDLFLRRPGIDDTPTGSICGERCAGGAGAAKAGPRRSPVIKPPPVR